MNILMLGGGGREHTLCHFISQSPLCNALYAAPGNAGTASCAINVNPDLKNFDTLASWVLENKIDLVIVGPEDPIVAGITDYFESHGELAGVLILAPGKTGGMLEGSKDFAKVFMKKYGIPTASHHTFTKDGLEVARDCLKTHSLPVVLKADGLAAGKGVVICDSHEYALDMINDYFVNDKFGTAGQKVVIEEFLSGIELSVFILTDGNNYILFPHAKDYKRIGENDTGLNTGGMGAVSPPPFADNAFMKKVTDRIIEPTMTGLKAEKIPYRGFIFFGLINCNGDPYVIEYNVRLGDPETEVIIPRIDEDIVPLLMEAASGNLQPRSLKLKDDYAVTVMLVSEGYPETFRKGYTVSIPGNTGDVMVFQAGTTLADNKIVSSGGRVVSVTSLGKTLPLALDKAYSFAEKIHFENKYFRSDIGKDLL